MREAERGMALTPAFEAMWRETISADRTGWLLCWRYHRKPDDLWTRLIAPVRKGVVGAFEPALDVACDRISERLL